ncbi:nucleotide sugar dehydrogenase [Gemmatirosa kalamazoonensis]|uniref:Nucleotide sugar dehydrogenase n=1 Tax=Gemmatirosa kalamazoonensis TaxID=861299 RepID=W0RJZ7_9BACT|nr:nucleotide sugar dehydrogenase [Gemmatirosa kalamazoonensis]AHG91106.1 nucleotide sugar dehydrogenase [Gemmatirosa kalamazoonensis]
MKDQLLQKIHDRSAVVGVVGLGYVGLPLAVEFAKAGFTVVGYDISTRVVELLNQGESHIQDVAAADVAEAVRSGRFTATTDEGRLRECDAISIAVPTPLSKTRDPDMAYVLAAGDAIQRQAHPGMVIVLESTTYPGTTRELFQPRMEAAGLTVGEDVFLAFSPERVDPGNPTWHTKNTPKVLGGVTPACVETATALYEACIERVVPVSSPEAAELVKLLENTFRAVNIGLVNEIAIICDKLGVDVWEVIEAAATKPFGYMKFTPGPGIGGHCIPLDPHYLAWKMRTLNYKTRFIDLASEINAAMPDFVVEKVARALNDDRKAVNGSRVLVLGIAYKKDIDDMRESPAFDVIRLLEQRGAEVVYHDPFVPHFREHEHEAGSRLRHSVPLTADELHSADAVVIVTDHSPAAVDYQLVVDEAKIVVDTRNVTAKTRKSGARVVALASHDHLFNEVSAAPALQTAGH